MVPAALPTIASTGPATNKPVAGLPMPTVRLEPRGCTLSVFLEFFVLVQVTVI
jgi:hypothetical protein